MSAPARGVWAAATAVAAGLAMGLLGGCGDGDEDAGLTTQLATDTWVARADRFCTDGVQEATALPLPATASAVAKDAAARAEIVATARDGLLTLGSPEGIDGEALSTYLAELDADIEQLTQAAQATATEDTLVVIDESAGQAANELGLSGCAAFSNAIAR